MKKKLIIAGVVLLVIAIGGYFGFQWYLNTHKAESEVVKADAKEVETKEETSKGITINSMVELNGTYISELTKPTTSEILFKIGGATATQGTFKDFQISLNANDSIKKIAVEIGVSSIYTAEDMRDEHLKGDEFFNVASFPKIKYTSSEIVKGDTSYIAKGIIKFMGIENKLSVPFKYIGQSSEDENVEIFEGEFDFDRVKFGMEGASGTENNVTISFYCALRKQ
jgi:polyisoprenoid-binding protein YceI